MVFDWVREGPFSYSNLGVLEEMKEQKRLHGLADNPHRLAPVGEDARKGRWKEEEEGVEGALRQRGYCLTCQPGILVALVGAGGGVRPAVLIRPRCFFLISFSFFFFRGGGVTSQRRGLWDGQLSLSPNCHRHCLRFPTG